MPHRSVFGVDYRDPNYPERNYSADWGHSKDGCWEIWWKLRYGRIEWYLESKKLNRLAYEAILKKFHLVKLSNELTMEKIRLMSPAGLIRFREAKRLPAIEVFSDTPGDTEARAEEYE